MESKIWHKWTYLQNRNRLTDTENTLKSVVFVFSSFYPDVWDPIDVVIEPGSGAECAGWVLRRGSLGQGCSGFLVINRWWWGGGGGETQFLVESISPGWASRHSGHCHELPWSHRLKSDHVQLEIIILSEEVRKRQIPYDITYTWNLKYGTYEPIYKTETDSQA